MKKFISYILIYVIGLLLLVGGFNYFMDPMWCFSHKHKFNQYQMDFNERQQKTNHINFQTFDYNALMIGSSRVAYISSEDIKEYKTYNYSVANMLPYEYNDYIEYAKAKNKKDFKMILIGLDYVSAEIPPDKKDFNSYKTKTESFLYRYKILFSLDTLAFSIKNIKNYLFDKYKKRGRTYNRNLISACYPKSEASVKQNVAAFLFPKKFQYNPKYKSILEKIKNKNKNTNFVVFTTPLSSARIKYILADSDNLDFYIRWLRETIDVFGEVKHFMYLNSVTKNYTKTFNGAGHYYPFIGTHIIKKTFSYPDDKYKDFGITLNKENFNKEIVKIIDNLKKNI